MVYVEAKINEKGQLLIPKILRDSYGLKPGSSAILSEEGNSLVIKPKKSMAEFAKFLDSLPRTKIKIDSDKDHERELRERWNT